MKTLWKTVLAALLGLSGACAQAGVIEDLLAIPAIQSMLGRAPELQSIVQRCSDPVYRQRNATYCQQAADASRLATLPVELRALLAHPQSAASIRELCLIAQGTIAQNSYLCAELTRADGTFNTLLDQQRERQRQDANRQRTQDLSR